MIDILIDWLIIWMFDWLFSWLVDCLEPGQLEEPAQEAERGGADKGFRDPEAGGDGGRGRDGQTKNVSFSKVFICKI